MSETVPTQHVQREPRVEIRGRRWAGIKVVRVTDGGTEPIDGELVDISRGGAKISIAACIPLDESVQLAVAIPELDLEFTVSANVSWSRQGENDCWLLGCCFTPALPDETVERLATAGHIERRHSPRYPAAIEGTASWELCDVTVAVWLQDFSADGFCMLCDKIGEVGQRIRLGIESADGRAILISAKVQWSDRIDNRYLVGCAFLNGYDFHQLWEITYQTNSNQPPRPRLSSRQSRWSLACVAALVAVVAVPLALVPLLSVRQSIATSAVPNSPVPAATVAGESSPPAAGEPGAAPAGRDARQTDGTAESIEDGRAQAKRQQTERSAQLARESTRLAAIESDLKAQRQRWNDRVRQQRAQLDAERQRLLAQQAAWTDQRKMLLAAKTAWEDQRKDLLAAEEAWKDQRRAMLVSKAAWEEERKSLLASKAAWEEEQQRLLAATTTSARSDEPARTVPAAPNAPTDQAWPVAAAAAGPRPARAGHAPKSVAAGAADVRDEKLADASYHRGQTLLLQRNYAAAAAAFRTAVKHDPTQPLYHYLLAMVRYQLNQHVEAEHSLSRAAELERTRPIQGWGRLMQRYQGNARLWLERARAAARATAVS